jgi:hypothetical protein
VETQTQRLSHKSKKCLYVIYEYSETLKTRMKKVNQANAKTALIFGDEELRGRYENR